MKNRQQYNDRKMNRTMISDIHRLRWLYTTALIIGLLVISGIRADAETEEGMSMLFGGCGGVYFYAEPGELWIDVAKQDLNDINRKTHLRAILFGPDRSALEEAWIDDDGMDAGSGPGPVQQIRLQTNIKRAGIYGLNITVSEDRYGEHMSWGFRTNCERYLVETSRGHRDARHQEPLVFRDVNREGDVCFMPQPGPFSIEVSGLAEGVDALPLYDSEGRMITKLLIPPGGKVQYDVPAGKFRGSTPWRLHLPKCQAVINIDGVTRWKSGEAWNNLSLWTPDISSWFPFHDNRWLLWPYKRTIYAGAKTKGVVDFTVHNNSAAQKRISLTLDYGDGDVLPAELFDAELTLDPYSSAPVTLGYNVPADGTEWTCSIRATVLDETWFSTWSSVTLRSGAAPANDAVDIPIKLEPYRHENEQLGFLPEYPLNNQVYFDPENRPYIIASNGVKRWNGRVWVKSSVARLPDGKTITIRPLGTKVAFDQDGDVYCVGRADRSSVLLHSRDHGATFTAWPIPGSGSFDIEQYSGHNKPAGPPPLARFHETAKDPNLIWRRINDLDLILPVKNTDGSIDMGEPVPISQLCIGLSVHSGIPSSIVSRGDKVHITWGEATAPEKNAPGVPTFVATYNRSTGELGEPVLVGYGPPANDIHNTPCITMDSKGYLHVLVGTHGRAFKYVRSLEPNSSNGGWTEAEDTETGLRQTYVGMVCDHNDTLHLVFRLWLNDTQYFPAGYYANLAYMSKRPGETWSKAQPLVVAPFSEYSIFYHRLTIDRKGHLFLSYDYWSTFWFYRTDHRGSRRSLLMSPDGGMTWKLAGAEDIGMR
ncbi:BNR-4 repeat-containing protein [Candidatus Latescibacterota bacterium]